MRRNAYGIVKATVTKGNGGERAMFWRAKVLGGFGGAIRGFDHEKAEKSWKLEAPFFKIWSPFIYFYGFCVRACPGRSTVLSGAIRSPLAAFSKGLWERLEYLEARRETMRARRSWPAAWRGREKLAGATLGLAMVAMIQPSGFHP